MGSVNPAPSVLWVMDQATLDYLKSRGYNSQLLREDAPFSLGQGKFTREEVEISCHSDSVIWESRSMSGALIGYQAREISEHVYRWFQSPKASHLPIIFGSQKDHSLFYETGSVILAEGIFDRVALKLCFPDRAVYSRLSKGVAKSLVYFLKRFGKRVFVAFDQDDPGRKAAGTTEERLESYLDVVNLSFPYKDPSLFLEKRGVSRMREYLKPQIEAMEF